MLYRFSPLGVKAGFAALVGDTYFVAAYAFVQILQGYVRFGKAFAAFVVLFQNFFHSLGQKFYARVYLRLFLVDFCLFAFRAVVADYVQIGFVAAEFGIQLAVLYGVLGSTF